MVSAKDASRFCVSFLVVATAVFGLVASLSAGVVVQLTDVENNVVVLCLDQDPSCDLNPAIGAIKIVGGVGEFELDVTTALSKPVIGSPKVANVDLRSVDVIPRSVPSSGGTLIIDTTDTDFNLSAGTGTLVSTLSGTLNSVPGSSIKAQQCLDLGNAGSPGGIQFPIPNCDVSLIHEKLTQATNRPLPFADQRSGNFTLTGGNFSITERVVLGFSGNGNAIFDFDSTVNASKPRKIPRRR